MQIRTAEPGDLTVIEAIVERGYGVYVERIGLRPGPAGIRRGDRASRRPRHGRPRGRTPPRGGLPRLFMRVFMSKKLGPA